MSAELDRSRCGRAELVCAYALRALPASEVSTVEAHIVTCADCRRELEGLRPVVESLAAWPTDVLRPPASLQARLARRIALETTGGKPVLSSEKTWREPEWREVAPGISCKLLASDEEKHVVSMLVRLLPSVEYPGHRHAGVEELHLLDGELWIDERKVLAGEYYRAEPGSSDRRVWSETGCTCVLVTSTRDVLN